MSNPPTKRRLSWRKRLLFTAILLVGGVALLELVCFIGIKCLGRYTIQKIIDERLFLVEEGTVNPVREVPHPYLGWVLDARSKSAEVFEGRIYPVNDFGLLDTASPIQKRAENRVIVAVIGGSVAWQTTAGGNEALLRELRKQPRFQGQEVILVRLAMSGYKQPQQLLLLTYLLSLGAEFDYLVNIDGFNEIALHAAENGRHHIFPSYPRGWKARNEILTDPESLEVLVRRTKNQSRRRHWTALFNSLPFQHSATLNFVWLTRDNMLSRSLQGDLSTLIHSRIVDPKYQITGPTQTFKSDAEADRYLVAYWQNCSRHLRRLCQVNQIEYYHVLPPNQHLLNSKPMSEAERAVAYKVSDYLPQAQRAYSLLVLGGAELRREGLRFYDLTQLFKDHPEQIYADSCCHYNPTGNEMLATMVAKIVGEVPQKQ